MSTQQLEWPLHAQGTDHVTHSMHASGHCLHCLQIITLPPCRSRHDCGRPWQRPGLELQGLHVNFAQQQQLHQQCARQLKPFAAVFVQEDDGTGSQDKVMHILTQNEVLKTTAQYVVMLIPIQVIQPTALSALAHLRVGGTECPCNCALDSIMVTLILRKQFLCFSMSMV